MVHNFTTFRPGMTSKWRTTHDDSKTELQGCGGDEQVLEDDGHALGEACSPRMRPAILAVSTVTGCTDTSRGQFRRRWRRVG